MCYFNIGIWFWTPFTAPLEHVANGEFSRPLLYNKLFIVRALAVVLVFLS
jgi:hypothetical protein